MLSNVQKSVSILPKTLILEYKISFSTISFVLVDSLKNFPDNICNKLNTLKNNFFQLHHLILT